MCPKVNTNLEERFRDDAKDMMFRVVMDANNTSAHGVQDDGKGYNEC